MLVEYAENEWINLAYADEVRIGFLEGPPDVDCLFVVWRGGDRSKPERYMFEGSGWTEYVRKVIRSAATNAVGEP